jgi:hypothetical protein
MSFVLNTSATMDGSAPSTELIEQQVDFLEGLVTSSYTAWMAFRKLNPESHDYHRISQSITRPDLLQADQSLCFLKQSNDSSPPHSLISLGIIEAATP